MTFLRATGCGLFPRWNTIVMAIPSRMQIKCSSEWPNSGNTQDPRVRTGNAPFQFLLGMTFLRATGGALFPRWNTIVMAIPSRMKIKCSSEWPNSGNSPPPLPGGSQILASEPASQSAMDYLEEDLMDLGALCNLMVASPILATLVTFAADTILLRQKEEISEAFQADKFVKPAVFEVLGPNNLLRPVLRIDLI
jgi:hypothetical protein